MSHPAVQTGSGKTYTMEGGPGRGRHGLGRRMVEQLFALLKEKARGQRDATQPEGEGAPPSPLECRVDVSMLEIYNDEGELLFPVDGTVSCQAIVATTSRLLVERCIKPPLALVLAAIVRVFLCQATVASSLAAD